MREVATPPKPSQVAGALSPASRTSRNLRQRSQMGLVEATNTLRCQRQVLELVSERSGRCGYLDAFMIYPFRGRLAGKGPSTQAKADQKSDMRPKLALEETAPFQSASKT